MKDLLRMLFGWLLLSLFGGGLILFAASGCTVRAVHEHNMHLGPKRGPIKPGPICVGDTVRLKSGGSLMTVRRIDWDRRRAQCEWVGGLVGVPHRAWFDLHLLQRETP